MCGCLRGLGVHLMFLFIFIICAETPWGDAATINKQNNVQTKRSVDDTVELGCSGFHLRDTAARTNVYGDK